MSALAAQHWPEASVAELSPGEWVLRRLLRKDVCLGESPRLALDALQDVIADR
jgi:hypothetical protein